MNGAIHKCISRCLSFVCRLSRAPSRFSRLHVDFPSRSSTFTTYRSALSPSLSFSLSPSRPLSSHQPLVKRFFFFSPSFFSMRFCFCFCHCLQRSIFFPPLSPFIFLPCLPFLPTPRFFLFFPIIPPFRVSFRSCVRLEGGRWEGADTRGSWNHGEMF